MGYGIAEKVGWVAHIVGKVLPKGSFKNMLGGLYDRHITFRHIAVDTVSSSVSRIIEWAKFEDGMLHVRLNNGLEYYAPASVENAKWWDRYRQSQCTDKQAEFLIFREAYGRLMEQFIRGIYEKNCQLQKGNTVIDVGAAWGFNTVDFSRKVGDDGTVVAIEPDIGSLVILRKNLDLNGCTNVIVVGKGLWSRKDKLEFSVKESAGCNSLVTLKTRGKVIGTMEIEVDTLDNILQELGIDIDKVALIKMDIEGSEIEALKGMDRIVSKDNDVKVAVASYHIVGGQPTHKTIIPMMEQMGFSSQLKHGISYFARR